MSQFLVADIGATNARFSMADADGLIGEGVSFRTQAFDTVEAMLAEVRDSLNGVVAAQRALFAIAGPEVGGGVHALTNGTLEFHPESCTQLLGAPTQLVNDFYALAHGVPHFAQLLQIGGEAALSDSPDHAKALLGPGSGLGMAGLTPASRKGTWQVLASEGGHAELPIGSHLEAELWGLLSSDLGYVSWESVLSGKGIENLYTAMCALWGAQAQALKAPDITRQGESMEDPICHQTLETFCAWLGAAAASVALTWYAQGGVYIGGGIVPKLAQFVSLSPLRRRFEESTHPQGFLPRVPIYVIRDATPGLIGAYHCLQSQQSEAT